MHKRFLLALLILFCSSHAFASAAPAPVPIIVDDELSVTIPAPAFTLWQLQTPHICDNHDKTKKIACHQMNSYVIRTGVQNKVIVIDGGMTSDATPLTDFLQTLGNHVDMWFVSHQHPDHIGALTQILRK